MDTYKTDLLDLRNCDCMDLMAQYPDKHFKLAIVDPPYGIDIGNAGKGKWVSSRLERKDWDKIKPTEEYFSELIRVSKNQVVFGGNYFSLPPSRCWIVWDKGAGFKGRDFAECELCWTSFDKNAKVFSYDPLAKGDYHGKIHPTQKPVALYRWLLANYASEGDNILDTHLGSASSAIACHYAGYHLTGSELDADYFNASIERVKRETAQLTL
jgi:site-specific DNA-methyltransferase (adenine-specific)